MPARHAEAQAGGPRRNAGGLGRVPLLATAAALLALVLAGTAALAAWRSDRAQRAALASLQARIAAIQPAPADARTEPCADWRAQQPLVLLALGQSNAANHGEAGAAPAPLRVVHDGRCLWASDPLPGGTGDGSSIWARLPPRLAAQLPAPWRQRPLVLAVLAVDATPLRDWVQADSPLRERLRRTAQALAASGLPPDLVLWQQGEADARDGTPPAEVAAGLDAFAGLLAASGINAPWMLAQSTRCRSAPHEGVRAAVQQRAADGRRFVPGPDTDVLAGAAMRRDGCHFSHAGLDAAADLWAAALAAYFARR